MKFFKHTRPTLVPVLFSAKKIAVHKKIVLSAIVCLAMMGFVVPLAIQNQGLDSPTPVGKFINNTLPSVKPGGIAQWETVQAFPNLSFSDPAFMIPSPTGSHFYIGERGGRIYRIPNDETTSTKELVLDISPNVAQMNDGGLYNMVLHPEFEQAGSPNRGYFYIYYTWKDPATPNPAGFLGTGFPGTFYNTYCRLSRFTIDDGDVNANATSELTMIHIRMYNDSHRGGGMAFGNDGMLHLTIGDLYRYNTAQTIDDNLEGGVMRMDVDQDITKSHAPIRKLPYVGGFQDEISGVGYFIPNDNPFLDPTGTTFEEYFTLGHRNPYRMSYDPDENRFWSSEVGQSDREEINVIEKGRNYGWSFREGTISSPRTPPANLIGVLTEPAIDFNRNEARSIVGGFVYRGSKFPSLRGKYLCGDWLLDRIYALTYDESSRNASKQYLCQFTPDELVSFGQDPVNGEIFMISAGESFGNVRSIYKLAPASVAPSAPALLSQTGVFKNTSTMEPEDFAIPYELNVPFWSDSAAKSRWIIVPNDGTHDTPEEKISFTENGNWQFPKGAVLVKHFDLSLDESNPSVTRRVETRLMVHGDDGVYYGLSYRWQADQLDAQLLTAAHQDSFSVQALSGTKEVVWYYPSREDCLTCHNSASSVIGPSTRQLNKKITYPLSGKSSNQIKTLAHLQMFQAQFDTTSSGLASLPKAAPSDDISLPLEDRARAYLDANCAYCHRPGAGNRAFFDARLSVPLNSQGLLYGPVNDDLGITGARVIVPQDLEASVLYQRLKSVHESIAMPPLAKNRRDAKGIELIADWINGMATDFVPTDRFTLGNAIYSDGLLDGWRAVMVINEADIYTNASTGPQNIQIDNFNFFAKAGGDPVTPFVARRNADNDFTILAIGDTRTNTEYVAGPNEFPFKDGTAPSISLAIGESIVTGFMDAQPNGTDPGLEPVIPYDAGNPADEIWTTGGLLGTESGSITVGAAPVPGADTQSNLARNYHYAITFTHLWINDKANQKITFAEISPKKTNNPPFSLGATSSSGLSIDYQIISGPASMVGPNLKVDGVTGYIVVEASQAGNAFFEAAPKVRRAFFVTDQGLANGTGFNGSYYTDAGLTNLSFTQIDPAIDFYWANSAPDPRLNATNFSIAWEGEIEAPFAETYTFTTNTDDGVKLWVNGVLLIDKWQDQSVSEFSGSIALPAGIRVPIRMEYYQANAYASAQLSWASASVPQQIVPTQFTYPSGAIFPVELLEFNALAIEGKVKIDWTTAREENLDYFEVERTQNGTTYQSVSQLDAKGNSQDLLSYTDWDQEPWVGKSYYRLKSIDIDGTSSYSQTVEVSIDPSDIIRVYPNPVNQQGSISLEINSGSALHIQLLDSRGIKLMKRQYAGSKELQVLNLPLGNISPGIYFLRIESNSRGIITHKLIVQ